MQPGLFERLEDARRLRLNLSRCRSELGEKTCVVSRIARADALASTDLSERSVSPYCWHLPASLIVDRSRRRCAGERGIDADGARNAHWPKENSIGVRLDQQPPDDLVCRRRVVIDDQRCIGGGGL